jgi:tetratricopeptide (TPR) repeat protein
MPITQEAKNKTKRSALDLVSHVIFLAFVFLVPIFFVPSTLMPFQTGKASFILYGIIALAIVWLVALLKDGIFAVPKSPFYAGAGILAAAYAVAAALSDYGESSLFGQGFELGTASFFVSSLALFALVPLFIRSKEGILSSYGALMASFFVVALFQGTRLVLGPEALSFGIFSGATASLLGTWNDLAILFGLSVIMSFITLEKASLGRIARILSVTCFVLSLAMLVVVNFAPVWIVLALISLAFFIREFSVDRKVPCFVLASLALSLVFVFFGSSIGGMISGKLGTTQLEVSPSLSMTVDVTKASLSAQPFFGVGPNRFFTQWLLNKPAGVNASEFWGVDFNYGSGFIPSFAVTTGAVGMLAAFAFVVLFAFSGLRMAFRKGATLVSRYLALSSFIGAAYLWVFSIISVPGPVIWTLTMILSGLFVAALREDRLIGNAFTTTVKSRAFNFVSVILITFSIIALIAFGYFAGKRILATAYFQKALVSAASGSDVSRVEGYLMRAIGIAPSDALYRGLAELELSRINLLLNDSKVGKEEARQRFQAYLSTAIQSANAAVSLDPLNYANQVSLGQVLSAVIPLKIEGSYEGAKKAYESALALNPENPEIYLMLARAEIAHGNASAARAYVGRALEKKGNYVSAVYLLAQLQMADKDMAGAIQSVGALATLLPQDSTVLFQLGSLYFEDGQYENAVLALGRAVELNPQYANARYALGLSLYEVGQTAKSLEQFKELVATNPENAEIKAIIENLSAGRAPLEAAPAPKEKKTKK